MKECSGKHMSHLTVAYPEASTGPHTADRGVRCAEASLPKSIRSAVDVCMVPAMVADFMRPWSSRSFT